MKYCVFRCRVLLRYPFIAGAFLLWVCVCLVWAARGRGVSPVPDSPANVAEDTWQARDTVGGVPEEDALDVQQLERMVVAARSAEKYSSSVVVISADEFAGLMNDLPGVLDQVAGVVVRRTGATGEYADASIRGTSARQVQVFLDGLPLNSALGGTVDLGKIPLRSLREITVYRGSAPLELMGNTGGAVIHLTTEPDKDISTGTVEAGSSSYLGVGTLLRRTRGTFTNRLSVDYTHADNDYLYFDDRGTTMGRDHAADDTLRAKENNGYASASAAYAVSWRPDSASVLKAQVGVSRERKEVHSKFLADTLQLTQREVRGWRFLLRYEYMPSADMALGLGIQTSTSEERFEDPLGLYYLAGRKKSRSTYPKVQILGDWFTTLGAMWSAKCRGGLGYECFRFRNLLAPDSVPTPATTRLTVRGAAQIALDLPGHLHAGVRYNHLMASDSANFSPSRGPAAGTQRTSREQFPTASADVAVEANDWLGFDVQCRYEHMPISFIDHFGWGTGYLGNPELQPEARFEYSIGVSINMRHVSSELAFFHGKVWDEIGVALQSQNVMMSENLGDVRHLGAEWTLECRVGNSARLDNTFHYIGKQVTKSINRWDRDKAPILHSPVKNDLRVVLVWRVVELGHRMHYVSPFYAGPSNTERTELKPELSAFLCLRVGAHVKLTYRIENYLDVRNEVFPDNPMPGRSHFFVGHFTF